MILASRQLKSGDLRFTMRNAKEAEIMRTYRDKWPKGLCRTAFVHMPTQGVIVYDVNVRSLGINKASEELPQERIIKDLLAGNTHNWGDADIAKISCEFGGSGVNWRFRWGTPTKQSGVGPTEGHKYTFCAAGLWNYLLESVHFITHTEKYIRR